MNEDIKTIEQTHCKYCGRELFFYKLSNSWQCPHKDCVIWANMLSGEEYE